MNKFRSRAARVGGKGMKFHVNVPKNEQKFVIDFPRSSSRLPRHTRKKQAMQDEMEQVDRDTQRYKR